MLLYHIFAVSITEDLLLKLSPSGKIGFFRLDSGVSIRSVKRLKLIWESWLGELVLL